MMQDRPTAIELTEAIREFLKDEILPNIEEPRAKFRTLVAMNALGILGRELTLEESLLRSERERLGGLLGRELAEHRSVEELRAQVGEMNRELTERIRAGETPAGTLETLKLNVADKLSVASPKYLERYSAES